MTFNDKINQFMKDNNIKDLKSLAIKTGIPYTTLRDFYNKKSADNSRLSTIRKLSEYMNCSLDYLAFDDNSSFDKLSTDNYNYDEFELLFSKYKDILTDDDKATMKFLIEKRIKEIDEQNNNK